MNALKIVSYLGFDFGGTTLRAAVVDIASGQMSAILREETPALAGPERVLETIARLAQRSLQHIAQAASVAAIGIGCPAYVDLAAGRLLNVPNVPGDWPAIPFRERLSAELGIPVHPINDVRAITLGEWMFGAGKGADTLACYAIGTGIGGGVVVNGRLHLGLSGSAGELGHQMVDPFGAICNCGSRGCLETVAAGPAIAARAAQAIILRKPTAMAERIEGDLNKVSTALVIEAAQAGDRIALEIIEQAGEFIGLAIVNTLVTVSPQRVLIGGGVAHAAGSLLFEPILRTVRERSHMVPIDQVQILPTQLGDAAGLLGAALWASMQPLND